MTAGSEKLTLEQLDKLQLHMERGFAYLAADLDGKDYDILSPTLEQLIAAAREGVAAREWKADGRSRTEKAECPTCGFSVRVVERKPFMFEDESEPSPSPNAAEELAKEQAELIEEAAEEIAENAVSERHNQGMHAYVAKFAMERMKRLAATLLRKLSDECAAWAEEARAENYFHRQQIHKLEERIRELEARLTQTEN